MLHQIQRCVVHRIHGCRVVALWAALAMAFQVAGCSSHLTRSDDGLRGGAEPSSFTATSIEPPERDRQDRLIVCEAELELEAPSEDSVHIRFMALAHEYAGYVVSSTDHVTTIRVLAQHFLTLLRAAEQLGTVTKREVRGADVTEAYRDLALRLDNAEQTRQRYLALLGKARSLDETLTLEGELRRIVVEIERLQAETERLSHRLKFATLTVETRVPKSPPRRGPITWVLSQAWYGARSLFVVW